MSKIKQIEALTLSYFIYIEESFQFRICKITLIMVIYGGNNNARVTKET